MTRLFGFLARITRDDSGKQEAFSNHEMIERHSVRKRTCRCPFLFLVSESDDC